LQRLAISIATYMTADPVTEHLEHTEAERIAEAPTRDRRRPGRLEHTSPVLIPLLRIRPDPNAHVIGGRGSADALGTARAICLGAIVGALCWTGMIGLAIRLLR
jgi:hypothetical protein